MEFHRGQLFRGSCSGVNCLGVIVGGGGGKSLGGNCPGGISWGQLSGGQLSMGKISGYHHKDTTQIDLDIGMDTNILNIKCASV